MSSIAIHSINITDNQITILFNQHWFQEDVANLRQLLLSNIPNLYIKEVVIGADLENVRFHWLDTEFIINFEYYSQSCWFETQSPQDQTIVHSLFNLLNQKVKPNV